LRQPVIPRIARISPQAMQGIKYGEYCQIMISEPFFPGDHTYAYAGTKYL
jgi:hypothetical protein